MWTNQCQTNTLPNVQPAEALQYILSQIPSRGYNHPQYLLVPDDSYDSDGDEEKGDDYASDHSGLWRPATLRCHHIRVWKIDR